jgi:hypothetical protein
MNCSECKNLYRAFERARTRYVDALCSAFHKVSTEIAASRHVDMERSKNDLQEHQLACPWAIASEFVGGKQLGQLSEA